MKTSLKFVAFLTSELIALGFAANIARGATPKTPTFFARRDYPGLYSYCVQVADTNGDKIPDLITNDFGNVNVLLGNGDGTFRPGPYSRISANNGYSFVPADFNGDGKIDLEFPNTNGIVVATGNGNGTFQTGVNYPINDGDVLYSVVGDFNGDGILDIAAAGDSGVWLLTGKGDGTFNSAVLAVTLSGAENIASTDFNLDSKLDLAVTTPSANADGGAGIAVLLGNGNGTFQTAQILTPPKDSNAIAVGSLTKGGPPSIAVNAPYSSDVWIFFGNGKGGFVGPKGVSLPGVNLNGLAIGDLNGDGIGDLISESGAVAYGLGGGYFTKPVGYPIEGALEIRNVVLADLRGNGQTDIVVGGYAAISVLLNVGKGLMEDGIWTNVTGGAGCGAAADFNGDGKPDLAVDNASGVSILLGTGKYLTPFSAGTNIALPGAACLVTGDLNGDGIADLLVPVNTPSLAVNAYLGNGDGTFTLKSTTPTQSGGYLALGDFNHDGKLDFVSSGNLIALGNGDGTFQNPTSIVSSSPGFSGIAVGDINNDGWADIVLTIDGFATATVLLNNQHGGFNQVPASFGQYTVQPILADLNGDGNLDLVLMATDSGAAVVLLGNGTGAFASDQLLAGPVINTPGINLVADVNGDGIPDISVLGGDTLLIFLGEGNATYASPIGIGTGSSPSSILVENLQGQSPKTGLPDLIEPDSSGGVMVLFNLTP
jgi:hypothetical protein